MRQSRFMASVLAVTTALALGAIGCGDDDEDEGGGSSGGGATQSESTAQVQPPDDIKPLAKLGRARVAST